VVLTTSYLVPFRNEVTRERNMDDVNLVARHAQTIRLTFALVLRWSLLRVVRDLKGVRAKRPRAVPLSLTTRRHQRRQRGGASHR